MNRELSTIMNYITYSMNEPDIITFIKISYLQWAVEPEDDRKLDAKIM